MTTILAAPGVGEHVAEAQSAAAALIYPETDGQPMGETQWHVACMLELFAMLEEYYREDPQVYAIADMFLYYEEGNKYKVVAPDVFVVFGVDKHVRDSYFLWEEGQVPQVVFEITSRSTKSADVQEKRALYEALGVREYFLFDPKNEYLHPKLRGFRLNETGVYVGLRPQAFGTGEWQLHSEVLGLELHTAGSRLRLFDPRTGEYLLSPAEQAIAARRERAARQREVQARQGEARARRAAEANTQREAEARQREVEARQREAEARRVAEANAQREVEARQHEAEARRAAEAQAEQLAAEVARLQAELQKRDRET